MGKQDEVIAYKAFFKGLKNNLDGINYGIGKEYKTTEEIQYMKGGFHMCEKPEDCFRFLRPSEAEVELTLVKGYGNMYGFDAGYRAYDDTLGFIYICEKMNILKVFTREEILKMALEMSPLRLEILISLYPFTKEEAEIIKKNYKVDEARDPFARGKTIPETIDYYQKKYMKRKGDKHE